MRYHFSGAGGAGMNPLARLMAERGHTVQGSDRSFDQGERQAERALLTADGVTIVPHDGSGLDAEIDRFVHSTAVEADTPEMRRALELELVRLTRPALLQEVVANGAPGVAVAGTSGKSTVVGMVAWILRCAGIEATILGGAALAEAGASHMGCFAAGAPGAPVIAEACESDGTLIGYRPGIGLIHNISRDHDELAGLQAQFTTFANATTSLLINAARAPVHALVADHPQVLSYGIDAGDAPVEVIRPGPHRAQGELTLPAGEDLFIDLPQPGVHNLENAAAAALIAHQLGATPACIASALASFPGVARRYQSLGTTASGVTVIDDYAHNADKLRAAITTAQEGCTRLLAVFQPHGFGPARFLRPELAELLPRIL
ncbi:MAG: Mur ligase domain-containing protein, partial [Planctomycetota bacterium]